MNKLTEAETVLTASMERWQRAGAPPWRAIRSANALGEAIYRQGRSREGESFLLETFRRISADPKADPMAKQKARERLKRYVKKSPPAHDSAPAPKLTVATQ
jgi:hypothetical protein